MTPSPRLFNRMFLSVVALPLVALAVASLAFNFEPLDGAMTRLGGYSENDFGWQGEIERFKKVHTDFAKAYDRPRDVLIIGDSFSHGDAHAHWQNYFHQATGLSMLTLHVNAVPSIEALVASEAFKAAPPRLVVYEGAEHLLKLRLAHYPAPEVDLREPPPVTGVPLSPRALETERYGRLDGVPPIRFNFSLTQNYLYKNVRRDWFGLDETQVERLALSRSDLFSNRKSGEMLNDWKAYTTESWTRGDIERIKGRVRHMRSLFEANGRTRFVFLPAPCKLTIYEDYMVDRSRLRTDHLSAMGADPTVAMPPIVAALKQGVAAGLKDVYMPNDLHWGPEGHRLASEALIAHLKATRFFAPAP